MAPDDLIPFNKVAAHIPGRPNVSTLHRWRFRGLSGVKLAVIYVGGRVYVSRAALDRFFEAVNAAKSGQTAPQRTDKQRDRAVAAAERELQEAGF
jgi:hypothetical protein